MKCENCGQEMLDIKDYCVNCGKKLKKDTKEFSFGKLMLIFSILIVIAIIICYSIMNVNLDKEIEPFINVNETE